MKWYAVLFQKTRLHAQVSVFCDRRWCEEAFHVYIFHLAVVCLRFLVSCFNLFLFSSFSGLSVPRFVWFCCLCVFVLSYPVRVTLHCQNLLVVWAMRYICLVVCDTALASLWDEEWARTLDLCAGCRWVK